MQHFTCDLCRRQLDPDSDGSYVVRMDVSPAESCKNVPIDDDRDHLEEFNEILERYEEFEDDGPYLGADNYLRKEFHLCNQCGKRFMQAPLGQQAPQRYELSKK
jgi:hypothetical protein